VATRYVETFEVKQVYSTNQVIQFLRENVGQGRVKFLARDGIYNLWLSELVAYYGLEAMDIPAASRVAADYQELFATIGQMPLRLFQLTNTRFFVGPRQSWDELAGMGPPGVFQPVLGFDFARLSSGGITCVQAASPDRGSQVLGVFRGALPRAAIYERWRHMPEAEALTYMTSREFDPLREALVIGKGEDATGQGELQFPEMASYAPGRIVMRCPEVKSSAILVLNDRYDQGWQVFVDGKERELLKCNFIMRGVRLSPGDKEVVFRFSRQRAYFMAGLAVAGAVLLWAVGAGVRAKVGKSELGT
jgi:hypothetical protein